MSVPPLPARAQQTATSICNRYAQFECYACADELWAAVPDIGLPARYLNIDSISDRNGRPLVLNWDSKDEPRDSRLAAWIKDHNTLIAETALHKAVEIDGYVFDNVFPTGIPRHEWEKKFICHFALKITEEKIYPEGQQAQ